MRIIALTLAGSALFLSACATPREACIASAQSELRTIDRLIGETRANIDRGYALETRQEIITVQSTCTGTQADGTTFTYTCPQTQTRNQSVPVAIDLNAEQRTLDSLIERQAQQRRAADAAIQQCIAIHPE